MTRQYTLQVAGVILGLVMLVMLFFAWHVLGIALEKRLWLYRLYRLVTMLIAAALLTGIIVFVWLGPGREMLRGF